MGTLIRESSIHPCAVEVCGAPVAEITLTNQRLKKVLVDAQPVAWPEGKVKLDSNQPSPDALTGVRVLNAGSAFAATLYVLHENTCKGAKKGSR